MSMNADNLKKNELVSLYLNKASGGKYVVEVKAAFVGIKSEDFIYLLEACKKVNLARVQDKDLVERSSGWQRGFEGSQPVLKLKEQLTKVGQILEGLNIPIGKKYSWGAFIQAHEAKIIPLMESLWFVRPMAQSFHYTRAAFMVMSCDQAYKYGKARFDACIATVRIVIANTDKRELMTALASDKKSKEVAMLIYAANKKKKFIPTLAETEEYSTKPLGSLGASETESMVASYPVDFRMYLQNRDFRRNQYKASDMDKARDFIAPVFALFEATDEIKDKVLMLQDKDAEWRKRYFDLFKNIKAIARSVRRVMAGEVGMNAQNAVRDYSNYSIKM